MLTQFKRRKHYRAATNLFKRMLNSHLSEFMQRAQGKDVQGIRDESEKPLRTEIVQEAITKLYVTVGSDFAKSASREFRRKKSIDIEQDYWEQFFKEYARNNAGAKIVSITGTTEKTFKDTVNRIITDNPDKGIYDIMSQIRSELSISNRYRAERIARTEVTAASNAGAHEAALHAGIELMKVWDAVIDGNSRDEHAAMHGEVRRLDEPFSNGQMYPGEGDASEVINCRCGTSHITEDDPRFVKPEMNVTAPKPI